MKISHSPSCSLLFAIICLQLTHGTEDGANVTFEHPPMTSPEEAAALHPSISRLEPTNRTCVADTLARLPDRLYCDKYYVCSKGVYVGQFCPVGMAFDYGQQKCRLRQNVRCVQRPLFFGGLTSTPVSTTSTTTHHPTIFTTTTVPTTTRQEQTSKNVVDLPFGGQVIIPAGSPFILPPGTRIHPGPDVRITSQLHETHH